MPEEVFIVITLAFFAGMSYWQLSPFFPAFLQRKGIDRVYVGVMLSTFAFFFLATAYFTGSHLLKWTSRLKACYIGGTMLVINMIGMASL